MNIKFYFLTFGAAILALSCNVNEDYDLTKVSTDNIEIGTENSVFLAPLATITLTSDDLDNIPVTAAVANGNLLATRAGSTEYGLTQILDVINAFLPSNETVSIQTLTGDDIAAKEAEIARLINLLVDELKSSEQKVNDLAEVLYSYKDEADFSALIDSNDGVLKLDPNFSKDDVVAAINAYVLYPEEDYTEYIQTLIEALVKLMDDEVVAQLKKYSDIDIDQAIESVELPSEVVDILGGDDESVSITATYSHNMPFAFEIQDITLSANGETVTLKLTPEGEQPIVNSFSLNKMSSILSDGSTLSSGLKLTSYTSTAVGDYAIKIKIAIQKRGSLNF